MWEWRYIYIYTHTHTHTLNLALNGGQLSAACPGHSTTDKREPRGSLDVLQNTKISCLY